MGSWFLLPNVPDDQQPLASGMSPARAADQQETCRKSRRDGCLVDRPVGLFLIGKAAERRNTHESSFFNPSFNYAITWAADYPSGVS
jgi:hypothetical protein